MGFKEEWEYMRAGSDLVAPFFKGLERHIAKDLFVDPKEIIGNIKKESKELFEQDKENFEDDVSKHHIEWAATLLCADEALLPIMSSEQDRLGMFEKSIFEEFKTPENKFMKKAKKTKEEDLKELFDKTINHYGLHFDGVEKKSIEGRFNFVKDKCFYYSYFSAKHKPYLTKLMCAIDTKWYKGLEENNPFNIEFKDAGFKSLGKGDEKCLFPIQIIIEDNK